jgi:hypothetical protein
MAQEDQKLTPPPELSVGSFGYAVAIDGDHALIGATSGAGAAFVFERSGARGGWTFIARLRAPAPEAGSDF